MKKAIRIASSLIMLGSVGTSEIFSVSGSLDIPDATDTAGNSTPAVNPSVPPTEPPVDVTGNGQQPKVIPSKGGNIQNLMDQLSSQLKNLLLTGGPNTARWEIDRNSLVKLIKIFDPQFSAPEAPATFGWAIPNPIITSHYWVNDWLINGTHPDPASRYFSWNDKFPDSLPETL
ncbi:MAG: hypothetical protein WCN27_00520 [Alphaproteobacteria bacterium]